MRLKNKVAIITGGASGTGSAATRLFLMEEAKVVVVDFNEKIDKKCVHQLKENGEVHFIFTDIQDWKSVQSISESTVQLFGHINILINNAGIKDDATLLKMDEDQFERVLNVNLKGVFNCTQAVAPIMIEHKKGKIINTSSVSGVYGNFGQSNYATTKAAVIGMTKTWAKELGRKGINVNAVAPGFTMTDMVNKIPEKIIKKMKETISINRLGKPEDIANAYLFLASDESDYVHSHVLHVDGGIMM